MTKEELLKRIFAYLGYCDASVLERITDIIDEFFSQNVVIPKGENRHPSSDVLHQAIEGVKIQGWNHTKSIWEDDTSWFIDKNDLDYPTKYRIKPSEPVYEWQAYYIDEVTGKLVIVKRGSTDDYFLDWEMPNHHIRVEKTKRIRP